MRVAFETPFSYSRTSVICCVLSSSVQDECHIESLSQPLTFVIVLQMWLQTAYKQSSGKREQQGTWFGPSVPGRLPKAVTSEQRSRGKADINW